MMSIEHQGPELSEVAERVAAGQPIDERWSNGLHLYIEQSQPVLYLHRDFRKDAVSASLLGGQTSLLIGSDDRNGNRGPVTLAGLAETVLSGLASRFGSALLVELWAEAGEDVDCDVRLVAPESRAPDRTMDVFEKSLARSRLNHQPWSVAVCVAEHVAPPGCAALIEVRRPPDVYVLGLAISARWRGDGDEVTHHKLLRDMRRGLGHALKEAGYDFARRHARVGAPHYHALGRRGIVDELTDADRRLCAIGTAYSLLLDVTPVNVPAARAAFREAGDARIPELHYRPLMIEPGDLKRRLYRIDIERFDDPALHDLLRAKREEIDREISLLDNRCGPRFLSDSIGLFGGAERKLCELARRILDRLPADGRETGDRLSAESMCLRARAEIDWLRERDPAIGARVELRADVSGLLVSRGNLLVGPDVEAAETRAEALIQHEVGTHIITTHNGSCQPLGQFASGMAGYEETQEGLAVLAEYLVGGLTAGRMRLLAARVLAVEAVIEGADFVEIVRLLSRGHGLSPDSAFTVAMRVLRGGGFTKDAVYLRGFVRVLEQLAAGTRLPDLLVGKIALDYWPIVEELRWRGIIGAPKLLPRYLEDTGVRSTLTRIETGLTVDQIIEEIR